MTSNLINDSPWTFALIRSWWLPCGSMFYSVGLSVLHGNTTMYAMSHSDRCHDFLLVLSDCYGIFFPGLFLIFPYWDLVFDHTLWRFDPKDIYHEIGRIPPDCVLTLTCVLIELIGRLALALALIMKQSDEQFWQYYRDLVLYRKLTKAKIKDYIHEKLVTI